MFTYPGSHLGRKPGALEMGFLIEDVPGPLGDDWAGGCSENSGEMALERSRPPAVCSSHVSLPISTVTKVIY